jgi:hypothetical protein
MSLTNGGTTMEYFNVIDEFAKQSWDTDENGAPWALVGEAIDAWPEFDDEHTPVNGGDLVEWFGAWRDRARQTLSDLAHADKS